MELLNNYPVNITREIHYTMTFRTKMNYEVVLIDHFPNQNFFFFEWFSNIVSDCL